MAYLRHLDIIHQQYGIDQVGIHIYALTSLKQVEVSE